MTEGATIEIGAFPARHQFARADALHEVSDGVELVLVKILTTVVALMQGEHRNLVRMSVG